MTVPQRYTDDELIQLVKDWDARLPGALTLDEFCRRTEVGSTTIQRRFGGWLGLRQRAGLQRRKSHLVNGRVHTREEFVEKLQQAVDEFGTYITQHEFCVWMGIAPNTINSYWGNWRKLRAAAGLPERKRQQAQYNDEDLMQELARLRRTLGHWPTSEEINLHGRFSYASYAARWGAMYRVKDAYIRRVERIIEIAKQRKLKSVEGLDDGFLERWKACL
jgi:hypothetical protein